jgi:hypothetical protein
MEGEKQEQELLEGFRRLCPADKSTVLTAVTIAVSAETAIKRELLSYAMGADQRLIKGGKTA